MSNLAKNWQEGVYSIRVKENFVEAAKVYVEKVDGHIFHKKKSAKAKCDPEDEFSLSMGVALAMDRLNKELGKNEIGVGDKVKVVNGALSYSLYTRWIKKNVNDVGLAACFVYGQPPRADETEYIVKAIAPWGIEQEGEKMLAYVQKCYVYNNVEVSDNEACYLIDIDGLEKV